jgi:hypothetical protein
VVVAEGGRDRSRKSAELDVWLAEPGALVITKPAGAEIWTEPSCWLGAWLTIVNAKEVVAPAAGLAGDTVTAKHLPHEGQAREEVDPAAGVASVAAASRLAATTPMDTRAIVKPAFRTAAPLICRNRGA